VTFSQQRETRVAQRLASVDAYRGFVMVLIWAEALHSCAVSAALPLSDFWGWICHQQTHAAWTGTSLHDLIAPSFYFLVGLSLVLSHNSARSPRSVRRVLTRAALCILLGMTLVAINFRHWKWEFNDAVTQIGLAYPLIWWLAGRDKRSQYTAFGLILVTFWVWFVLSPLPASSFDYASVGVPPQWLNQHGLSGFLAHWQKNSNPSSAFDRWFLNLLPQPAPYLGSPVGLTTLNFVPSIATMLLGVLAGSVLYGPEVAKQKVLTILKGAVTIGLIGWVLDRSGICPIVKAIWTPSYVLFSGAWCLAFLATFYVFVDILLVRRAAFPLVVVGRNSIVAYCLAMIFPAVMFNSIRRVTGGGVFEVFGAAYTPAVYGCVVMLLYWSVLWSLHRRKIFIRI